MPQYRVERAGSGPILWPDMDDRMGDNVNGPSLIRVPDWVERPLGRYYLYFAHHQGRYIRLAWADRVEGPWTVHRPGVLPVEQSGFLTEASADYSYAHVASPDLHVDPDRQEIRMYFHGLRRAVDHRQTTRVALSRDGLSFEALPQDLGPAYFRCFRWRDAWYAWAMPGCFHRSPDGLEPFEQDPSTQRLDDAAAPLGERHAAEYRRMLDSLRFPTPCRHGAVRRVGSTLHVAFSMVGDAPERLKLTTVDLADDWTRWKPGPIEDLLTPEEDWEGADLPVERSKFGAVLGRRAHALRDPCFFEDDDGRLWLLYAAAGEAGIGLARLRD